MLGGSNQHQHQIGLAQRRPVPGLVEVRAGIQDGEVVVATRSVNDIAQELVHPLWLAGEHLQPGHGQPGQADQHVQLRSRAGAVGSGELLQPLKRDVELAVAPACIP